MSNQAGIRFFKFALAFGLIFFLIKKGFIEAAELKSLCRADVVITFLLLAGANLILSNWRWLVLLKARHFDANFKTTYPLSLIGLFFNYALPGAVGGDVIKAYYVAQENPLRKIDAITTVIMDRLLGLYCMIAMAMASFLIDTSLLHNNLNLQAIGIVATLLFLGMTTFFVIVLSRRLTELFRFREWLTILPMGSKFLKLYETVHAYSEQKGAVVKVLVLSLFSQLVAILFIYSVGIFLNETNVPVETYLFAVPIGFIVSAIPILPAGIGVGQVAFSFLFRLHSHSETSLGQTAITAYQITFFVWSLVGCYFYLSRKKPAIELTPSDARDSGSP